MSNITLNQDLQDKLVGRVQELLGSLIEREDMDKLIAAAIQKSFFEERRKIKNPNSWNSEEVMLVSRAEELIVPLVEAHVKTLVDEAFKVWLLENQETFSEIVTKVFENRAGEILVNHISTIFNGPMYNLQMNLNNMVQQLQSTGVLHR